MTDLWGTLTRDDRTGTVEMIRTYDATPDDLWHALTDPDRLARWLGDVRGDLRVGGDYEIRFDADDPEQRSWGTIEACEAPRELRVTWRSPGEDADSHVVATVSGTGGRAELRLVHTGLDHLSDAGYAAGWQVHLGSLEATLAGRPEHGDPWDAWPALRDAYAAAL